MTSVDKATVADALNELNLDLHLAGSNAFTRHRAALASEHMERGTVDREASCRAQRTRERMGPVRRPPSALMIGMRALPDDDFASGWHAFADSRAHDVHRRGRAMAQGLSIVEWGVATAMHGRPERLGGSGERSRDALGRGHRRMRSTHALGRHGLVAGAAARLCPSLCSPQDTRHRGLHACPAPRMNSVPEVVLPLASGMGSVLR